MVRIIVATVLASARRVSNGRAARVSVSRERFRVTTRGRLAGLSWPDTSRAWPGQSLSEHSRVTRTRRAETPGCRKAGSSMNLQSSHGLGTSFRCPHRGTRSRLAWMPQGPRARVDQSDPRRFSWLSPRAKCGLWAIRWPRWRWRPRTRRSWDLIANPYQVIKRLASGGRSSNRSSAPSGHSGGSKPPRASRRRRRPTTEMHGSAPATRTARG